MTRETISSYALLIGVHESRVIRWALPGVAKDIKALMEVLTHPQRCAYPKNHVKDITGADATRQGILDGLEWLQNCIQADSSGNTTAIVYYTGHGWRDATSNTLDYYLIPYDVQESRISAYSLRAIDFAKAVGELNPRRLLVVLDCCHAGGMDVKGALIPPTGYVQAAITPALLMQGEEACIGPGSKGMEALAQGSGRAVLSSSAGEQRSYMRRDGKMSIFTYHLIEALTGHAQPQEGATEVLVSDVMGHVWRRVPKSAAADWGVRQEPDYQVSGNFPIALLLGGKGLMKGQSAPDPLIFPAGGVSSPTGQASVLVPKVNTPLIRLTAQEKALLQHVHSNFREILVERKFGGGYSGTRVLLILPIMADGRRTARKVTKLGPVVELRREWDNYMRYVGPALPFCVAQVESERYGEQGNQACLNYIFVGGGALGQAVDLEEYYTNAFPDAVERITKTLNDLLDKDLGQAWYGQNIPLNCFFAAEYGRHLVEQLRLKLRPESSDALWLTNMPPVTATNHQRIKVTDIPHQCETIQLSTLLLIEGLVVKKIKAGVAKLQDPDNTDVVVRPGSGAVSPPPCPLRTERARFRAFGSSNF